MDWEEAAAFLEHERPERWAALPELDDLLGGAADAQRQTGQ
jgi:hypothetical protein